MNRRTRVTGGHDRENRGTVFYRSRGSKWRVRKRGNGTQQQRKAERKFETLVQFLLFSVEPSLYSLYSC